MLLGLVVDGIGINSMSFHFLDGVLNGLIAPDLVVIVWWLAGDRSQWATCPVALGLGAS